MKTFLLIATAEAGTVAKSCTGSDDPVVSAPRCYHGSGGALGLTENVDVKIFDLSGGAGHIDVTGDGIEAFTCSNKDFTKAGQTITTDLSDCQPKGITISDVNYCSDQDTIKVTVKDDTVPLPISAQLARVDCSSREALASCSGEADPDVSSPRCYHGSGGALGLTENVDVKISDLSGGAGHIDVSGDGIEAFTCSDKDFTKAGQTINTDLSDCQPQGITISKVNYCSDQDTIKVTVKDDTVPLPVTATLKKVDCTSAEALASCSGEADPDVSSPRCYHGSGGALGLTENVDVKISDLSGDAGHIDVSGDGIEAFTCSNKDFTKAGQTISTDLSDCQPKGITISKVNYCSDQDTIRVTVKDDTVPLPVTATLKKVDCTSAVEV